MSRHESPWRPVLALLGSIVVVLVSALSLARMDPIRVRASWIARLGEPEDFGWNAGSPPADFLVETTPATPAFVEAMRDAAGSDLEDAALAVRHIATFFRPDREAIQRVASRTLREMRETGIAYCSDVSQVFVGLAHARGLFAREWSVYFGAVGGSAHSFNEIFDRQRNKWVMVDAQIAFVPLRASTGEPLSFLEFRELLATRREREIRIDFLGTTYFSTPAEVFAFYRPGLHRTGLTWGNAEFSIENGAISRRVGPLSIRLEQALRILVGSFPALVVLPTELATSELTELRAVRTRSLTLLALAGVGLLLLPFSLAQALRALRRTDERSGGLLPADPQ